MSLKHIFPFFSKIFSGVTAFCRKISAYAALFSSENSGIELRISSIYRVIINNQIKIINIIKRIITTTLHNHTRTHTHKTTKTSMIESINRHALVYRCSFHLFSKHTKTYITICTQWSFRRSIFHNRSPLTCPLQPLFNNNNNTSQPYRHTHTKQLKQASPRTIRTHPLFQQ